jgi:hypothetical protein
VRYPGYVDRKLIMVNGQRYHFAVKISDGVPRLPAQGPRREAQAGAGRTGARDMSTEITFGQVARDMQSENARCSCGMLTRASGQPRRM